MKPMKHIKWVFSGVGVVIIAGIINNWQSIKEFFYQNKDIAFIIIIVLLVLIILYLIYKINEGNYNGSVYGRNIIDNTQIDRIQDKSKEELKILFIDDNDVAAIKTLRNNGWTNIGKIDDLENLSDEKVNSADILFIDINGVGKKLGFPEEGLDLALALMKKYPNKKYVIYSAQTEGKRIHEALSRADALLEKDAVPYEFINVVENLTE